MVKNGIYSFLRGFGYGKPRFPEDLSELSHDLSPSTLPRFAYQTSPNQTPIDKRRIKTI